jgi:hypothetical protein
MSLKCPADACRFLFNKPMKNRSSLPSLLTLAAGASALPFAAEAGIIYTDLGTQIVGFGGGELTVYDISLPGTAIVGFAQGVGSSSSSTHRIVAHQAGGYVRIGRQSNHRSEVTPGIGGLNVAFRTDAGANWVNVAKTGQATFGNIIRTVNTATVLTTGPGGFSDKYLLFTFKNSLSADQLQYGWVGMSAATATAGAPLNMSVTLSGWAYDDSGAVIEAGAIPEPSTAALLMGGALVAGAAGLRQWRKRKQGPKTAAQVEDLIP